MGRLHNELVRALEEAKTETLAIAESTRHPIRKKRALNAFHQACELLDFIKRPSIYRNTERWDRISGTIKAMMRWLFLRTSRRYRVFYLLLGFYRCEGRGWRRWYTIRVTNDFEAEFRIKDPSGYMSTLYGD